MADDDDEWRFSVDEVGPDDEDETEPGSGEDATGDDESDAWGVTVGEDRDGPTVTVGGPERAAEEVREEIGDEGGNVAGTFASQTPIERGTPDLENVVFTGIGALVTIVVFVSLVEDDPVVLGGVAVGVVVAIAALYAFFTRV